MKKQRRRVSLRGVAFAVVLCALPAAAGPGESEKPALELPAQWNVASLEKIDTLLAELGKDPDFKTLYAELDAREDSAVIRYARARASLMRCAVWDGERAVQTLEKLRREAAARQERVLAARLLVIIGRGQLGLGHNAQGLQALQQAVSELRAVGDDKGLATALYAYSYGLILDSHRPSEALPYINELLVHASRHNMPDRKLQALRLYDEWRESIEEVDDYFGRARNRLQYFPPALGIPEDADLVAFADGVLIMNGDTDDQVPAAKPEFVRFDGLFTRRLELPGDGLELRGSMVDSDNKLWAATNRGLYRYNGKTYTHIFNPDLGDEDGNDLANQVKHETAEVVIEHAPLLSNIVNEVKQGPYGKIYLASEKGVSIYDPGTGKWEHLTSKNVPIPRSVERVAPLPDGGLVIAWHDEYVVRKAKGGFRRFTFQFPRVSGRPHGKLFGLLADRDGHAWVHGLGGAHRLEGTKRTRLVDKRFAAVTRNVNHVLKAADGAYWFASTDGLCRQEGTHCATLNAGRWMPAEWTLDLLEWPENSVWASVYQGGLNCFLPPHYRHFGVADGFRQPVNETLQELDGYLFTTNGEGLTRLDPESGRIDNFVSDAEGIPSGELKLSVRLSTGQLALAGPEVGNYKILVLFDGRRGTQVGKENGLPDDRILSCCEAREGQLLIAYRKGLWLLDTNELTAAPAEGWKALQGERVRHLECSPGRPVWALTRSGLYRRNGKNLKRVNLSRAGLRGRPGGLVSDERAGVFVFGQRNMVMLKDGSWQELAVDPARFDFRIRDVAQDDRGRLYFSTESGVFVSNGESWIRLGVDDGLVSDTSFGLLFRDGWLWISGGKGVASWKWPRTQPPETFLMAGGNAYHIDPSSEVVRWRVSNGVEKKGWVQRRGLAGIFETKVQNTGSFLPAVRDTAEEKRSTGACDHGSIERLADAHSSDKFEFMVSAGTPYMDDGPEEFTYHYRLDGGAWKKMRYRRHTLTGLADGEHILQVRSTDPRLNVDSTPARLCLVVETPASPWLLAGGFFLIGVFLVFTRRQWLWYLQKFRHRHFREIDPSPFTPRRPAQSKAFVGRTQQLDSLDRMAASGGGVAVVWGQRGMGKNSLMRRLGEKLRQPRVQVVELDLAIVTAGGDVARLVASLAQSLLDGLNDQGIELDLGSAPSGESIQVSLDSLTGETLRSRIKSPPGSGSDGTKSPAGSSASGENPFDILSQVLALLEQAHPEYRVIFLLDNAEVLGMAVDFDAGYGSYLFPFLRSLAQQRSSVTVVLAMEGRWFDLSRQYGQLFAFATPFAVDRLTPEEGARLISNGMKENVLIAERDVWRIVDLAGGHPLLLQRIGDRLVAELNRRRTNVCSRQLIDNILDSLVNDAESELRRMFLELTREEKLVVAALCESDRPEATLDDMVRRLAKAGGKLLYEEVRRAVLSLVKDGTVLQTHDTFYLQGDLFRMWVLKNYSVATVLEESHDYVGHFQLVQRLGGGGMG